jgi:hypothetical protein
MQYLECHKWGNIDIPGIYWVALLPSKRAGLFSCITHIIQPCPSPKAVKEFAYNTSWENLGNLIRFIPVADTTTSL